MTIKSITYILLLSILFSCASTKQAKLEAEQMESAPQWVKSRPVSNMYYIGIAKVSKNTYKNNYQEAAKKQALADLSSEIGVKIESNSIISSFEDNGGFQSEFSRYIRMEMQNNIEGYQQKGEFETSSMYMVYYQLSKAKWKIIQEKRKNTAASRAYTQYSQGLKDVSELSYPSAIRSFTNGLLELKKYWNEPVYYKVGDSRKRIDIEIRQKLSEILSEVKISVNIKKCVLNNNNSYRSTVIVNVVNAKGNKLKGFPISVNYRKTDIPFQTTIYSEEIGYPLRVEDVRFLQKTQYITLELEKDKVVHINSEDRKLLKFINDAFETNPIKIPLTFVLPKIFISVDTQKDANIHYLADAVAQSVRNKGFDIVSSEEKAELIFQIDAIEEIHIPIFFTPNA